MYAHRLFCEWNDQSVSQVSLVCLDKVESRLAEDGKVKIKCKKKKRVKVGVKMGEIGRESSTKDSHRRMEPNPSSNGMCTETIAQSHRTESERGGRGKERERTRQPNCLKMLLMNV